MLISIIGTGEMDWDLRISTRIDRKIDTCG